MILITRNHDFAIGPVLQGAVFLAGITPQGAAHTISCYYPDP